MKLKDDNKIVSINKYNKINKINLIGPYGFGDTIILCGFKEALEDYYKAEVNYIIKPEHEVLMKLYDITNYSLRYFDEKDLEKIANKNSEIKINCEFVAHPNYLNDDKKLLKSFLDYEISFIDLFRNTLGLPDDAMFQSPKKVPQISQDLQNELNKIAPLEKIILFSPESFSTKRINRFYLEDMVEGLQEGYVVVSSVLDKDETVKGSIYVDLTFEDALAVAINCSKVFAVRSGFVDVLIKYRKDISIIYPEPKTHKLYSLKKLGYDEITEMVATGSSLKKYGPIFQAEDKGNERLYRICLTLLRVKKKRDKVKYCVFGIPVWIIKTKANYKKYYLFGCIYIFRREL